MGARVNAKECVKERERECGSDSADFDKTLKINQMKMNTATQQQLDEVHMD